MQPSELEDLLEKAGQLAGRKVDVERLKDGTYSVIYLRFGRTPPRGKTAIEAVENFIKFLTINQPTDPGTDEELRAIQDGLAAAQKGDGP